MHINRLTMFVVSISLICIITLPLFGCGSNPDITSLKGETVELIKDIAQADSSQEREEGVQEIIKLGHSLGIIDKDGQQMNPNVSADAISLTPDDITALAYFTEIGHYRTIGSVVDYLAEAGIILSSTEKTITFEDLLPDLQEYVNWSFNNTDNPDSQLGLMIGSGPNLETPASAPSIGLDTQISPMAAILMIGDILIGIDEETADKVTGNWFTKVAYADDLQETAKRIQGYITQIESFAKPAEATLNFLRKAGETLGLSEPSKAPPTQIKVPKIAKEMIAAFAMGNHFVVRIRQSTNMAGDLSIVKSLDLDQVGDSETLYLSVELIAPGQSQGKFSVTDIKDIPVMYTLRLLSPNETGFGTSLYPDADAVLSPGGPIASTSANGHIMDIAGKGIDLPAIVDVKATKLDNKVKRVAILHASATILTRDLGEQYAKYSKQYAGTIKNVLGLKPEEVQEMFSVLKTAVTVSPWMAEIILTGGREVTIEPSELKGEPNQPYKFTAKIDDVPAGSRWDWSVYRKLPSGRTEKVNFSTGPDNVATVSFPVDGNYIVEVILWDSVNEGIDEAMVEVVIAGKKKENTIEISFDPPKITGETGCQVLFKVVPNVPWEELPEGIIWQWDFGDDTKIIEQEAFPRRGILKNVIYHNYTWSGTKDVTVKILDGETKDVIAMAEAVADINDQFAIQRTTHVRALFWAFKNVPTYEDLNGTLTKRNDFKTHSSIGLSSTGAPNLQWAGNQFHVTWGSTVGTQTYVYTIDGRVSTDVSEVEEITLTSEFKDTSYDGKLWTRKETVVLKSIPIEKYNCGDSVRFYKRWVGETPTGYPLAERVEYTYESRIVGDYGDKGDKLDRFEGFDYSDQKPAVEIEFLIPK